MSDVTLHRLFRIARAVVGAHYSFGGNVGLVLIQVLEFSLSDLLAHDIDIQWAIILLEELYGEARDETYDKSQQTQSPECQGAVDFRSCFVELERCRE